MPDIWTHGEVSINECLRDKRGKGEGGHIFIEQQGLIFPEQPIVGKSCVEPKAVALVFF